MVGLASLTQLNRWFRKIGTKMMLKIIASVVKVGGGGGEFLEEKRIVRSDHRFLRPKS